MDFYDSHSPIARFGFIAISAALLLSVGCVVGPNFKKPAPPHVPNYTPTAPDGDEQHSQRPRRGSAKFR